MRMSGFDVLEIAAVFTVAFGEQIAGGDEGG